MHLIKASVGIAGGKQCYNVVSDQLIIIDLLNSIPVANGGCREKRLSGAPRWGVCSGALHSAIVAFQSANGLSVDGHVDPGGRMIQKLNLLSLLHQDPGNLTPQFGPDLPYPIGPTGESKPPAIWRVSDLSLSGLSVVSGAGAGAYSGQIKFSHPDNGDVALSIRGSGFAAGYAGSLPLSAKGLAGSVVQFIVENFGTSLDSLPSSTLGVCYQSPPWGNALDRNAFRGVCYGGFFSEAIGVVGQAEWVLFFGIPDSFDNLLEYGNMLAGAVPVPFAMANAGLVLDAIAHAKGVALILAGGVSMNLSTGASANQFIGRIG